jgi:hypothetical protein
MRFLAVIVSMFVVAGVVGAARGEPLPLNDGIYVTNPELCFLDVDQLVTAYTDRIGRVSRTIEGATLSDNYEMYCDISDVRTAGSDVQFKAMCSREDEAETIEGRYTLVSRNAFRVYGELFRRCGSDAAIVNYSDGLDADSGSLVASYWDANGRCRGESGSNPKTLAACAERTAYSDMLEARQWCFGREADAEYQKFWAPCAASIFPNP